MATPKKVDFLRILEEELKSGEYTVGEKKAIKKLGKNLRVRVSKDLIGWRWCSWDIVACAP